MTSEQPSGWVTRQKFAAFISAVRAGDASEVEKTVAALSRVRRSYAPLAFLVGAFAMLFDGLKLLVLNWRLGIVEALPAMWVWLAMLDLRVHLFGGREFRPLHGAVLVGAISLVAVVTMAAFFLNGVFAFALATPGAPMIRPALSRARDAWLLLAGWGLLEGAGLGTAALLAGRWGKGWFVLSTGAMIGLIMFSYVAIPSRVLGTSDVEPRYSRRDRVMAAVIGGVLGAIVCTPPYLMGRLGVVMLSIQPLIVPALLVLIVGFGLQAAASGAVKAIRMSSKLVQVPRKPGPDVPRAGQHAEAPAATEGYRPCGASKCGPGPSPDRGSMAAGQPTRSSDEATQPR